MMVYMNMMQWYEDGISSEDAKMKEMAACITKSYTIWTLHWINSFEAKKAASILAGMIRKVRLVADKSAVSSLSVPGVRIQANLLSDLAIGGNILCPFVHLFSVCLFFKIIYSLQTQFNPRKPLRRIGHRATAPSLQGS